MKIVLAQQNYIIGDFASNYQKMKRAIDEAKAQQADLIVFPELAICGYPPADFLLFADFIDQCEKYISLLANECDGIAAIVGAPSKNPVQNGKRLLNSAYFLFDQKVQQVAHKTLLPNYDIFDETRYFETNSIFEPVIYKGKKIGITICEDIWDIDGLYHISPLQELSKQKIDFAINISASPFDYNHYIDRLSVLNVNANKYNIPIVYVNHVGAHTDIVFDGGSMVVNAEGEVKHRSVFFKESLDVINIEKLSELKKLTEVPGKTALINDALKLGIKDYFEKLGFKKAIVGLSGGIDSAVTLVLAAEVLGAENVKALLLPSKFSSGHSVDDSIELCENINVNYEQINIQSLVDKYYEELQSYFHGTSVGLTEENIQARVRSNLLMAFANKFNFILLNTSNKSERAVGYGTLYGDLAGGISVLGDVYKTEVYKLAEYINRNEKIIPQHIITKPPSAELKPDQKDSDTLPDYDLLDKVLHQYIELNKGPKEIIAQGFEKKLVDRILKMVNLNEWKRYQVSPVIRVSPKAFGMGRRMPIVGKYLIS